MFGGSCEELTQICSVLLVLIFSGGKLKTLAEKDEESLQAGFYNVHSLFNGKVKLR